MTTEAQLLSCHMLKSVSYAEHTIPVFSSEDVRPDSKHGIVYTACGKTDPHLWPTQLPDSSSLSILDILG